MQRKRPGCNESEHTGSLVKINLRWTSLYFIVEVNIINPLIIEWGLWHLRGISDDTGGKNVRELGKPSPDKKTLSIRKRNGSEQAGWRMRP